MKPVNRGNAAVSANVPVDRLIISLRSYVTRKPGTKSGSGGKGRNTSWGGKRVSPQEWVLVFDCETRTTPDQQLRFGTYQLRHRGHIIQRGAFYDSTLGNADLEILKREVANERPGEDGERIFLLTRLEFIERVLFNSAYYVGAQIAGFNLPFDLSRLAIAHTPARRSMKGGFSLILHESKEYPRVVVKRRLKAEEQGIKILANATSYGIFVELNVQDLPKPEEMIAHSSSGQAWPCDADDYEKPGRYFHPLLATLITGAARLMLSLAERQVMDQGLDWVFCDTDSLAIANRTGLPPEEFKQRALKVRDWFTDLNPYEEKGSILQLEKVNFPPGKDGELDHLSPPYCLAISAKRYALFNRDADGNAVIRKASGHGLGHLRAPYDEPMEARRERISRIGVPLWQEDFWREIIRSAESDEPDQVPLDNMKGFDSPAASQYAATKPDMLRWFEIYNKDKSYADQVKPFNFLLSLYAKSRIQMALDDSTALTGPQWDGREPRPAAPYHKDTAKAAQHTFDRERPDQAVPVHWLKSLARNLARYHLHPEQKFWDGDYDQRGVLKRRHVHALAFQPIGKEADEIEERELLGEDEDPIERPFADQAQMQVIRFVEEVKQECKIGERDIMERAKVSHHTLNAARKGKLIDAATLRRIAAATVSLRERFLKTKSDTEELLDWAREAMIEVGGRNAFARLLDVSAPYLGRVLSGQKPPSEEILGKLREMRSRLNS